MEEAVDPTTASALSTATTLATTLVEGDENDGDELTTTATTTSEEVSTLTPKVLELMRPLGTRPTCGAAFSLTRYHL